MGHVPAPGFFGKVMSHADFVSRRMPPGFLQRWDGWLQEALHVSRQRLGPCWLATYLHSPIWRFALAADACDAHAWAGIMMPSVDSVGRQFPLTIVVKLAPGVDILDCLCEGQSWYAALETLALSSLGENFVLADFDLALSVLPAIFAREGDCDSRAPGGLHLSLEGIDQMSSSLPAIALSLSRLTLHGHSLWWSDGSEKMAPSLLCCKGLPAPASVAAMLDGCWEQGGWQSRLTD